MTLKNILIRDEKESDYELISQVTKAAFAPLDMSEHNEQFIIKALRRAQALSLSLVAEIDGQVVAHIAFSPVTISSQIQGWYGLGPLSVHPRFQGQGIGTALVKKGVARLKNLKAKGCVLVGHPGYYQKFGFQNVQGLVVQEIAQEFVLALSFDGHLPQGQVDFHQGFGAKE
ncbi:MAG: N-acetyltransferase [Desulfomicrobium sp.]|nr:N-acetyltransferase [Desulfomicrobium sp.]